MPLDALTFPFDDPVLALLRVGRRRLVENGWHQGMCLGIGGSVCAGFAIGMWRSGNNEAPWTKEFPATVVSRAAQYLSSSIPYSSGERSIAKYNDLPTTTLDDVLALYDRAIAARVEDLYATEVVA